MCGLNSYLPAFLAARITDNCVLRTSDGDCVGCGGGQSCPIEDRHAGIWIIDSVASGGRCGRYPSVGEEARRENAGCAFVNAIVRQIACDCDLQLTLREASAPVR